MEDIVVEYVTELVIVLTFKLFNSVWVS